MADTADKTIHEISYDIQINDHIKLPGNIQGIVKYIGPIIDKPQYETYYGIAFKKPIGNTSGRIKKKIYFKCKPKYGKFVQRKDIVYPFPIIFNELCDTTFHILSSRIFLFFDPVSIGNFCRIDNGLCKIIFNVQKNYNLSWKKQWRLFIASKSEDDNFKKRWELLYNFYKEHIYPGKYCNQEIGFGVWKITNIKDDQVKSNAQKALTLQRTVLPIISKRWYYKETDMRHLSASFSNINPLKFAQVIKKVKMKNVWIKAIKTETDATINVDAYTLGSVYYKHIKYFDDIFKNDIKESKPFYRKYHGRKPLKELRRLLKYFLMPSFLELSVKQWFVVNLSRREWMEDGLKHSYIIGWISAKKLIVIGGAYGSYDDEVRQSRPTSTSCNSDYSYFSWSD